MNKFEIFDKNFNYYSFGQHQDFLTYYKRLNKFNLTIKDLEEYIEEQKRISKEREAKVKAAQERWDKIALRCPECNSKMSLATVNTSAKDQTGDDSKSVWLCPNRDCFETIYNKQSVKEIMKGVK